MLKQIFHKDIFLILFINIFIDVTLLEMLLFLLAISLEEYLYIYIPIAILMLNLSHCCILPVFYSYMKKSSDNIIIKKFITNLKCTSKYKVIVLIITSILPLVILNIKIEKLMFNFINIFLGIIFPSAFGSYITLFLYWYVKDNFSEHNIISKILNILINKYTFVFSISIITLGYLIIPFYLIKRIFS
ncbi:hypothetical protein IKE67_00525 [bacterium]|nr:hypothetical protein [bacterium]